MKSVHIRTLQWTIHQGHSRSNALCTYLMQAVWPWSGTCPNLFTVSWALVCHVVWLGKCSCVCCIPFKMDDLFQTMSKHIKQWAVFEFLTHENETPIEIHWWLLAFYGEDIVGISMCITGWENQGIAAEMWTWITNRSGRPVTTTHHLNRQKINKLIKKTWRFSETAIAKKLNIGLVCVNEITAGLAYKKVCTWWVLCQLMPKIKREKLEAHQQLHSR